MIEVSSHIYSGPESCSDIMLIRKLVFVDEQQVDRAEEFDSHEEHSMHYLGKFNDIPAGTARWRISGKGIKLERFAVLHEFRKQGIAAAVLQKVLNDVIPFQKAIYLHAQVTAVGFYEKYGFKKEGPLFTEANIDHFTMSYIFT